MAEYLVLARKYRPKTFGEVLGQDAVVKTLKNAIRLGKLAHAYLFCGSRGTGKTTLARVFAKALNCQNPNPEKEPCNQCSSCKEIGSGNSMDVLEIDGASHRGIDDIRQINDNVGYSSSSGKYKIYIIDEVHMLTKEAFNALLKTLEEPPAKVLFIFATTEPHKVLPTILSRCQRFNLNRIPLDSIISKLQQIARDLAIDIDKEALLLLAQRSDGGLRDAESLLDQIIAFHEGKITVDIINDVLGIMSKESLFIMDKAGKEGHYETAFEIAHQIFSKGKDIIQFVDTLTEHFRTHLLVKISGISSPLLSLPESEKKHYESTSKFYTQEQCLTILDFLIEAQNQIRFVSSPRIALEALILRIMRTHERLPIGFLVKRLSQLELSIQSITSQSMTSKCSTPILIESKISNVNQETVTKKIETAPSQLGLNQDNSITEDPSPTDEDLKGCQKKEVKKDENQAVIVDSQKKDVQLTEVNNEIKISLENSSLKHKQSYYDTLLNFAAVELEGSIQKK